MMSHTYTRSIAELQHLTQEYASFSQSRSGLGNVLGGVTGLASFLAIWLLGRGLATTAITIGLTLAWLVGKEVLRRQIYRPFGDARETWPAPQRRAHALYAGLITLLLAIFAVAVVVHAWQVKTPLRVSASYFAFCLVTPWIMWRYLRTLNEFMVGFYLLFACAVTGAGFVPDLLVVGAILPLYSVLLITLGLKEHRQFQELSARLRRPEEARA